jgi:hypothetical protein
MELGQAHAKFHQQIQVIDDWAMVSMRIKSVLSTRPSPRTARTVISFSLRALLSVTDLSFPPCWQCEHGAGAPAAKNTIANISSNSRHSSGKHH